MSLAEKSSMRWLFATLGYATFRLVSPLLMAAGGGALAASIFVMQPASPEWGQWITPVRDTALAIGVPFLGFAAASMFVMPAHREMVRFRSNASPADLPFGIQLLLAALVVATVLQVPMLLAWWDDSRGLLEQVIPERRDPSGLWIIPAAFVVAMPFLATLLIAVFVVTPLATFAVHPTFTRRVLWTGILLAAGIVAGSSFALVPIRDLASRLITALSSGPDAAVVQSLQTIFSRQDSFASTLVLRFQIILAGFVLAGLAIRSMGSARTDGAALASTDIPGPGMITTAAAADHRPSSSVSAVFTADRYRVRLQSPWLLAAMRLGRLEYEIAPLPARLSDKGFLFSESDGLLKTWPGGDAVLTVRPAKSGSLLSRSYEVTDASSRQLLGTLQSEGADWKILDEAGRPIARVEGADMRQGFFRYRVFVDSHEVCCLTWTILGLGVWTAEMDVEFTGKGIVFDRAFAIAIAPILEAQARRKSQRLS